VVVFLRFKLNLQELKVAFETPEYGGENHERRMNNFFIRGYKDVLVLMNYLVVHKEGSPACKTLILNCNWSNISSDSTNMADWEELCREKAQGIILGEPGGLGS